MAILTLQHVSKRFGGLQAVNDVSFALAEGRITSLIGPNGAGKTTLFNLITGFLPADAGTIAFRDRPISGLPPYHIARLGIARSFQDLRVFARMTVLDNLLIARQRQTGEHLWAALLRLGRVTAEEQANREKAMTSLAFVRLADKAADLGENLSYGQQKLLIIARLLAMEGELLLLDEPTAGLDPTMAERMITTIQELVDQGKTICLIEHNLDVIKALSDWVIFLDQGQVVAEGKPSDILSDRKLIEIYLGL